ncbi:MAG: L-lactate permease [Coriobacteriia bacterium]|nr:L-lactate permease [Coriobacteriia bacterium]
MDADIEVSALNWLLAALPLAAILVLLVGLRWTAAQAGAAGFFIAAGVAWLVFRAGFEPISVATAKGLWDAVFILYVVWTALLLYEVTDKAGAFDAFRVGAERYTDSKLLLVLAFGWVFASFMQGIAGFGTPIAIVAPLLVGIGVRPLMAVVIPLIGHAWANLFGTLAVAWLAALRVAEIEAQTATAVGSAVLLWIPNLLAGLTIVWLYGRGKALARAWPAVLAVSLVHGGGQALLAGLNPIIANFIPATLALGVILAVERLPHFQEDPLRSDILREGFETKDERPGEARMSLPVALTPYFALIALTLAGLLIPPVNELLERVQVGFAYPEVRTGLGFVTEADEMYGEFAVFSHPGTFLLLAAVLGYLFFRSREAYRDASLRDILAGTVENALPASIAVMGFLALSKVMEHAGMVELLALGIAAISPPLVYAFLANLIGVLGAFMTSSNTASNILFTPLQQQTAAAAGLSEAAVLSGQMSGAAVGNSIAPANVVLGTSTAQISGREGDVLKYTLVWAMAVSVLIGGGTLLFQLFGL